MRTDDEPPGGDPPCWAHSFEEDAANPSPAAGIDVVDLAAFAHSDGRGPVKTLLSDDLNVNLLVFGPGEGVAEHENTEVDALFVGIAGEGVVTIAGRPRTLRAGQAILVPKGTRRGIRAGRERFSYLTCHRRRPGLRPALRPSKSGGAS